MRKNISLTERIAIASFLKENLKKVAEGLYEYLPGMSDPEVARRFNCKPSNVTSIRVELFGNIRKARPNSVEDRLAALEDKVADLERRLAIAQAAPGLFEIAK